MYIIYYQILYSCLVFYKRLTFFVNTAGLANWQWQKSANFFEFHFCEQICQDKPSRLGIWLCCQTWKDFPFTCFSMEGDARKSLARDLFLSMLFAFLTHVKYSNSCARLCSRNLNIKSPFIMQWRFVLTKGTPISNILKVLQKSKYKIFFKHAMKICSY